METLDLGPHLVPPLSEEDALAVDVQRASIRCVIAAAKRRRILSKLSRHDFEDLASHAVLRFYELKARSSTPGEYTTTWMMPEIAGFVLLEHLRHIPRERVPSFSLDELRFASGLHTSAEHHTQAIDFILTNLPKAYRPLADATLTYGDLDSDRVSRLTGITRHNVPKYFYKARLAIKSAIRKLERRAAVQYLSFPFDTPSDYLALQSLALSHAHKMELMTAFCMRIFHLIPPHQLNAETRLGTALMTKRELQKVRDFLKTNDDPLLRIAIKYYLFAAEYELRQSDFYSFDNLFFAAAETWREVTSSIPESPATKALVSPLTWFLRDVDSAARYLRLCEKQGVDPRFAFVHPPSCLADLT